MPPVRDRTTAVHVAVLIAARIIAGAVSAITAIVLPHAMGPHTYGQYGIAIGIAGMLVVLSDLGMTTSLARFLAEGRVDRATIGRVAATRLAISALAGLALVAFGAALQARLIDTGHGRHEMVPYYLYLSGALVLANSVFGVTNGLLPTLRLIRAQAVLMIAQPVLELAGMLTALALATGAGGVIVASTASSLAAGGFGLVLVLRHTARQSEHVPISTIWKYSRSMFAIAVCFAVFGLVDQLVLWWVRGSAEAANYIACWRLIALLHLPGLAAATVIAPRLAGGGDFRRAMYLRWLAAIAIGYAGITTVLASLAGSIVPLALGPAFVGAAGVYVALSVYAFLLGIAPLATMTANFLGGARPRIRLGLATVTVNLVLDVLLIPRYGAYGAAFSTSVAFTWYVASHVVLSFRLLGGELPTGRTLARMLWQSRTVLAGTCWVIGAALVASEFSWLANETASKILGPTLSIACSAAIGLSGYAAVIGIGWSIGGKPWIRLPPLADMEMLSGIFDAEHGARHLDYADDVDAITDVTDTRGIA